MMQGFISGGNTGITPESLARRRAIIERLQAPAAPTDIGSGLTAIGNALAGAVLSRRQKREEAEARAQGDAAFQSIMASLYGGGAAPAGAMSVPADAPRTPGFTGAAPVGEMTVDTLPPLSFASGAGWDAVESVESGGRADAVSPAGAVGVAQVMPATARDPGYGVPNIFDMARTAGIEVPDESDATLDALLRNPDLSRQFGQSYMGAMEGEFGAGSPEALAAYNAGPGAVGAAGGVPDYQETQDYVARVQALLDGLAGAQGGAPAPAAPTAAPTAPPTAPPTGGGLPGGLTPEIMQALGNPFMTQGQRSIVEALIGQRLQPPERMSPYQLAMLDLRRQELEGKLSGRIQTGANVTVGNDNADTFSTEAFRGLGKAVPAMIEQGAAAAEGLARLAQMEEALQGIDTGNMAGARQALREWTGLNLQSSDEEVVTAVRNAMAPLLRQPGSGEMSDRDVRMFLDTLPGLINTPDGNQRIIQGMRLIFEGRAAAARAAQDVVTPGSALYNNPGAFVQRLAEINAGMAQALRTVVPPPLRQSPPAGPDDSGVSESDLLGDLEALESELGAAQ